LLEGSCRILQNGVERSFNYVSGSKKEPIFIELGEDDCFFGIGVRGICLDPFYTVAADLRYHKPGEVIYVPALVGRKLPNGESHNGFLVVRDTGGAIRGPHRFDFFSGSLSWQDPANTFSQIHLNSSSTRVVYYRVLGEVAREVLQKRGFPRLPRVR
jgi:3D (Asp-Asp-Asp) domain-containing protein